MLDTHLARPRRATTRLILFSGAMLVAGGCMAPRPGSGLRQHWPDDLVTPSERSGYRATGTHAEVLSVLDAIAQRSPIASRQTLGRTFEGRDIPLLILADPPVASADEARRSGRIVVYLQACIHGGEVCGKPALLQLAREIALDERSPDRRLLDDLVLVICPIYNADGDERMAPGNRGPAQNGPTLGMGERANAQGLDLNRDHMKLESPEAQALVRFLSEWNPELTIDTHTTDGSRHRFALTYAPPQNPSGHPAPIELTRDRMLPDVSRRLEARTGLRTFFYGNFNRDHTVWATYSHKPRFATPYRGLRNRMSILSEAYAYDTYEERVRSTREFVRECLRWAAGRRAEIESTLTRAEDETVSAPKGPAGEKIGIRYKIAAFDQPVTIPGLKPVLDASGKPTGKYTPVDYTVEHDGAFAPTLRVRRPYAYVIPPEAREIVHKLLQHGVRVDRLPGTRAFDAEVYQVDKVTRADRVFQGHRIATVDVSSSRERAKAPAGAWVVPMDQPLANLAIYLLEPASDDGLAAWGFYDDWLTEGARFPIIRAMEPVRAWTSPAG